MDALGAIRSLAELQTKFQPDKLLIFDSESILNMAADIDNSGGSDTSTSTEFATFAASSSESANAKIFDYRGEKVAGFEIDGKQMICLPQVYELFLKTMVGGLHTVYTKLRRLDILPLVCNVEQVRALRGFGAIQPGVNRCKLIDMTDCDKLYEDCTNTCTRPGRPAKRMSLTNEDWSLQTKKSKPETLDFLTEDLQAQVSPSCSMTNPLMMGHFLPQLTAQQLLIQHMLALSQQQQHDQLLQQQQSSGNSTETVTATDSQKEDDSSIATTIHASSSSSLNTMSSNRNIKLIMTDDEEDLERTICESGDGSDMMMAAQLGGCLEGSDGGTPSTLSKANTSTITNSEGGDSEALENMRKIDSSLSPSQRPYSDRGSSSENSQSSPSSDPAFSKIMNLIDMATENFKLQREALTKEKREIESVWTQIRQEENRLRQRLDTEQKRSSVYFRRYCKLRREAIELKEQLLAMKAERIQQN